MNRIPFALLCDGFSVKNCASPLTNNGRGVGTTDTAGVLRHVRTSMLNREDSGDHSSVPNVVVVITDGLSNNRVVTAVSSRNQN